MTTVSSAEQLVSYIRPGQRIFVHGAAATPEKVLIALAQDHKRLAGCEIMHLHTHGTAPYVEHKEFRVTNLFVGENLRKKLDYDRVDYLPCFLSEVPLLFRRGIRPPDVAIVQVSPPDKKGFCSLGTSVDVTRAAVDTAKIVLAHVNPKVPRTHGDGQIPLSRFTAVWNSEESLLGVKPLGSNAIETQIAKGVASLIEDGSTLQMGIGGIPECVLASLKNHRHLGVHTEMFSDGLIQLIESGAVDNSRKSVHAGKTVTSFVNGSEKLFAFVDDDPSIVFLESDYVNRSANIARNQKVVAINSAVEVDLTGQVVADSIGHRIISGVGGQMDFIRGASLSPGGKAIIAITSRTKSGASRLVSELHPGAGVVTTRAHVQYIVTEYGIANLYGKTLGERAKELINIAHPDDRERLSKEWYQLCRA
jgi:acyl-CoA hydrolase